MSTRARRGHASAKGSSTKHTKGSSLSLSYDRERLDPLCTHARILAARTILKFVLCLLLVGIAYPANSQDEEPCKLGIEPIGCFTALADSHFSACQRPIKYEQPAEADCISRRKKLLEPFYALAVRKYAKRKETVSLIKDFYSFWLTSMDEIKPRLNESRTAWNQRVDDRRTALLERGNRLNLEGE